MGLRLSKTQILHVPEETVKSGNTVSKKASEQMQPLVQCLLILFNNMRLLRMLQGWQADRKQI